MTTQIVWFKRDLRLHDHAALTAAALRGPVLCPDYSERIVGHAATTKAAKDTIYALRRRPEARAEAKAVVQKHGSRKSTRERIAAGRKAEAAQMALDF